MNGAYIDIFWLGQITVWPNYSGPNNWRPNYSRPNNWRPNYWQAFLQIPRQNHCIQKFAKTVSVLNVNVLWNMYMQLETMVLHPIGYNFFIIIILFFCKSICGFPQQIICWRMVFFPVDLLYKMKSNFNLIFS